MYLNPEIIGELKKVDNNLLRLTDFRVFSYPGKDKFVYAACIFIHQETGIEYTQLMHMDASKSRVFGQELIAHAELARTKGPSF
jgi:hypothetical protein